MIPALFAGRLLPPKIFPSGQKCWQYEGSFKYQALQPDGIIGSGYFRNSFEGYSSFEKALAKNKFSSLFFAVNRATDGRL